MKQILFIAALLVGLAGAGQVRKDNLGSYVRIVPVDVKWNSPKASRLYISYWSDVDSMYVINWQLYDSVYIDHETNNYHSLGQGQLPLKVSNLSQSVLELEQYIFLTTADILGLRLNN